MSSEGKAEDVMDTSDFIDRLEQELESSIGSAIEEVPARKKRKRSDTAEAIIDLDTDSEARRKKWNTN